MSTCANRGFRRVPYGCITIGQRGCGRLVDFAALAPEVVGFSDDGRGVQSDGLMEEAMRRAAQVGKPVVAHCEVDDLLRGGYIHDGEYWLPVPCLPCVDP